MEIKGVDVAAAINSRLLDIRMPKTEFAAKVGTSKQNVPSLINRVSLSTEVLRKFSEVLDYNFFEMFVTKKEEPGISQQDAQMCQERVKMLEALLSEKDKLLQAKDEIINYLKAGYNFK
jgi:predicted regulator of amino acid metabolism with ACT domain